MCVATNVSMVIIIELCTCMITSVRLHDDVFPINVKKQTFDFCLDFHPFDKGTCCCYNGPLSKA